MAEEQSRVLQDILEVSGYCGIGISSTRADLADANAGIHPSDRRKAWVVIDLVRSPFDTPAKQAGLEPKDILTHYRYDGQDEWMPITRRTGDEKMKGIIRGEQGSHISLRLIRARTGQPYEVTLTRDSIIELPEGRDPTLPFRFIPEEDSECRDLSMAPGPTPSVARLAARVRGVTAG